MRIGAVIGPDQKTIVPLPDGPIIRVRDTENNIPEDYPNPAYTAETHRRPTAAKALVDHHIDVVLTVPGSFCSPSHKIARQGGIAFWPVESGSTWQEVGAEGEPPPAAVVDALPLSELMKQNLASIKYYWNRRRNSSSTR
ncbi:hypothetical protein [Sulfobacillus thermosulfidooxidans]|uniref:hypothetical protein n=1 Tax=Sulfobacillus thermosulfidooxidans TaxID=28034 RepID=UPI0004017CD6|nr:hypothetical protein [Sulfobacillus thermosulfidooxidans]